MESYSDSLLLKKIRKGDFIAFEVLYRRYFQRLKAFALHILNDEELAKDMVQEVFIKVWEKRMVILDIAIEAYLYRLLRNRCYNYIRDQKILNNKTIDFTGNAIVEELYRITEYGDEPYQLIEEELERELSQLLDQLSGRTKEIFLLSRTEGLSNKEIAGKLSCSVKNVEKNITAALRLYREYFRKRSNG